MNCEVTWRRDASDDGNYISSPEFPNSNQTTSSKKEHYIKKVVIFYYFSPEVLPKR